MAAKRTWGRCDDMPLDRSRPYEVEVLDLGTSGKATSLLDRSRPFEREQPTYDENPKILEGALRAAELDAERVWPTPTEAPSTGGKSRYALAQGVAQGFADTLLSAKSFADPGAFNPEQFKRQSFERAQADPGSLPNADEALAETGYRDPVAAQLKGFEQRYKEYRANQVAPLEAGREFFSTLAQAAQTVRDATPGNEKIAKVVEGAGSMAATALAAPIPGGGVAVSAMQSYGSAKAEAQQYYEKLGLPEKEVDALSSEVAQFNALSTGYVTQFMPKVFGGKVFGKGVEAWTERVIVNRLKNSPAITQAAAEVLKDIAGEATEEGVDQLIQGAVSMRYHRPDLSWKQAMKESLEAAIAGGFAAGTLKTPMAGAALSHKEPTKAQHAAEMAGRALQSGIRATELERPTLDLDLSAVNALNPANAQRQAVLVDRAKPFTVERLDAQAPVAPQNQPAGVPGGNVVAAPEVAGPTAVAGPVVTALQEKHPEVNFEGMPEPQPTGDFANKAGVYHLDSLEKVKLPLPKKMKATAEIQVAQNPVSGKWAPGSDFSGEGVGGGYRPNISQAHFDSKEQAINEAAIWIGRQMAQEWRHKPDELIKGHQILRDEISKLIGREFTGKHEWTASLPATPESGTVTTQSNEQPATVEAGRQPDVVSTPGLDGGTPAESGGAVVAPEQAGAIPEQQGGLSDQVNRPSEAGRGDGRGSTGTGLPRPDSATGSPRATRQRGKKPQPEQPTPDQSLGAEPRGEVKPLAIEDRNHVIEPGDTLAPTGDKSKANANMAAIRLLKTLEAENRNPSPAEKKVLAQYVGWGGLAPALDTGKAAYRERSYFHNSDQETEYKNWEKSWGKIYDELQSLLTEQEFEKAQASTKNAHYTSREVVESMWAIAEQLGFKKGNVLESSAGIGNFMGLTPAGVKAQWNAVEKDSISGRMLAKLYPEARVQVKGFEEAKLPLNAFDLVIGNPPFDKDGPYDPRYPSLSLHNYFLVRSMDLLKPGGLLVNVTSSSTMDNEASRKARQLLTEKADLVGAIRLPNNAFKKNAGTEVTTDILIFRKKDALAFQGAQAFLDTTPVDVGKGTTDINEYFARHPDMMMGRMSLEGTQYGPDQPALIAHPGQELAPQLKEAQAKLPKDVIGAAGTSATFEDLGHDAGGQKEDAIVVQGGGVYVVANGVLTKPEWASNPEIVKRAKDYAKGRDIAKALFAAEFDPQGDAAHIEGLRKQLNDWYDEYVKRHGFLNAAKTRVFRDEAEFPLVGALENIERIVTEVPYKSGKNIGKMRAQGSERYHKADTFTKRTLFPSLAPEHADTAADAVASSMAFRNSIDLPYVARLLGRTEADAEAALLAAELAYKNPASGLLETPDEYLSGWVRDKLTKAREAAADEPAYNKNVEALQKVQPDPIPIENITFRLGATWMPPKHIEGFLRDVMDVRAKVSYNAKTQEWAFVNAYGWDNSKNRTTYGVPEIPGHELVMESLNLKNATVFKTVTVDGKESRQKDGPKTLAAQEKQEQVKKLFVEWARANPEASADIFQIYNDQFNGVRLRKYDGPSWDHYPNASHSIKLRPHQKAVVTRILQNSTLLAHAVGTGKTFVMITAAMEQRRLGLAKKPMIVTQNATTRQFAAAFKKLYPAARVLVPSEKERKAPERQRIMARIATGEWDAVIIPQSFLDRLPDDPARVEGYIKQQKKEMEEALISSSAEEGKKSPKVKQLQKALEKLDSRLKELSDRAKDNVVTFEQLGVDSIFVDEAHEYKKLQFTTKMDSVKGLDTGASQKGFGLHMKTRFIHERNAGKNVTFATGTPISNTIAEAWTMMRYIRPDVLAHYHIETFDDFAGTFGETATELEMTAGGDWKNVTRFARFTNGPELIAAFHTVADVVLAEDVNLPGVPGLENNRPTNILVQQTPQVSAYVAHLRKMLDDFDKMTGKEKRDNSSIPMVAFGLAKKVSLDLRLVDPDYKDEPGSKPNIAVAKIKEIYDQTDANSGTQLVFADLFQSPDPKKRWLDEEETRPNPAFGKTRFNLYEDMKAKLVKAGIPAGEIAIITEHNTDAKREALFAKVQAGEVRVLFGSTAKMGVGVNVQDRLYAIHHLAPPARPMDIEQRNGRILRQGNMWASIGDKTVKVVTYGIDRSLDATLFQVLARKQKFINQVLRGDLQGRNFEDAADEASLTFEEQMAAYSGDPLTLEKVSLENRLRQLESLSKSHVVAVARAKADLQELTTARIPAAQKLLAAQQAKAEDLKRRFGGDVTVDIGGRVASGAAATAAMDDLIKGATQAAEAAVDEKPQEKNSYAFEQPVGEVSVNGVPIVLGVKVHLDGAGARQKTIQSTVGWMMKDRAAGGTVSTGAGFMSSLRSGVASVEAEPDKTAGNIDRMQKDVSSLTGFVQQPFDRAAELIDVRDQLKEVMEKLAPVQRAKEETENAVDRIRAALEQERAGATMTAEGGTAADLARQRLAGGEAYGNVNFLGLKSMADLMRDLTIVGVDLARRGFNTFGRWSAAMLAKLGEKVKRYLPEAWKRTTDSEAARTAGLTPDGVANVNRIMATSEHVNEAPDFKPVYPDGKIDSFLKRAGRLSRRLAYFGTPDLLRAKQELDLRESYQAAAVKSQSDRLLKMMEESAYTAKPDEWKLPKWMRMGGWAKRLREFKRLALPIAAHLHVTGKDASGRFVFTAFEMRAGLMSTRQFKEGSHTIGDTILTNNPLTGEEQELTIGHLIETDGRTGYQLTRQMPAEQQQEIYRHFQDAYPEFMWVADIFIDPDLADTRYSVNGVEVPLFNRFALAAKMAENSATFSPVEAYTPDVLVSRSLMGAVRGALGLRRGTRSPGRKYKSGAARESGSVRDLFSGFNVRTFQMLQETARREFFQAVVKHGAEPIRGGIIPEGYVKLETGIEEVWNAVKRLRRLDLGEKLTATADPEGALAAGHEVREVGGVSYIVERKYPETEERLQEGGSGDFQKFMGEAAAMRGKQLMLPQPLVDLLVKKYAAHQAHGRLWKIFSWLVRNSTQLMLAHPKTYVNNVLTNDMFALEASYRYALAGSMKLLSQPTRTLGKRDLRLAGNILGGMLLHRARGLRELLNVADETRYMRVTRQVLPDSVFADSTQLADVKVKYDDSPFDLLRRGEIGGAVLQGIKYGAIDVRAKQRLAFAYLKANAVTEAKASGLTGAAMKAAVDSYLTNPPIQARVSAVAAANFEMLNYSDSPEWLNRFARNDVGRLFVPFPRFGYHFLAKQAQRISALKLFLGKVPKGQRANALADLITVATFGLGGGGIALHAIVKALFGVGDDDDDPRKYIGTSMVKYVDTDGTVKTKALDRELVTSNRIRISGWLRGDGIEKDDDTEFWLRVRSFPMITMAGAAVLGMNDAKKFGVGHGVATYLQAVTELGGDFFSLGMAVKVPDKVLAELRSLESGKPQAPYLDPYATHVPLRAYITEQTVDSIVPGTRQFDELVMWLDRQPRRRTASKELNYDPGIWEALRISHVGGVVDRLIAALGHEETSLPAAGPVVAVNAVPAKKEKLDTRMLRLEGQGILAEGRPEANIYSQRSKTGKTSYHIALVPEKSRQPMTTGSLLSSAAGFNIRGVPRDAYEAALGPKPVKPKY